MKSAYHPIIVSLLKKKEVVLFYFFFFHLLQGKNTKLSPLPYDVGLGCRNHHREKHKVVSLIL